jgi:hypothetical protein
MTGFQGDSEQFFQLIQQYRIVIPRARARARSAARGFAAARGIAGRAGRGGLQWAPSNMSNSTRHFSPTSEVGAYNHRTDTFFPALSGTITHLAWDGSTNSTLMTTFGSGSITISSETLNGSDFRTLTSTNKNPVSGNHQKSGTEFFYAFVVKINSTFENKGLYVCGNATNGHALSFDGTSKPVLSYANSSTVTTITGSSTGTTDTVQVHVVQRFGNNVRWSIDGVLCINEETTDSGGSGNAGGKLFRDLNSSNVPDYELVEFFRSDMTATTNMDRLKTEGYLCHKYGISLPRDHRFFRTAPTA